MTEQSYQEGRKLMQKANYLRGVITKKKGIVAKWSKMEDANRENGQEGKAEGCKKMLQSALLSLDEARKRFADLKFPDNNLSKPKEDTAQCEGCGAKVKKGENFCENCLN